MKENDSNYIRGKYLAKWLLPTAIVVNPNIFENDETERTQKQRKKFHSITSTIEGIGLGVSPFRPILGLAVYGTFKFFSVINSGQAGETYFKIEEERG